MTELEIFLAKIMYPTVCAYDLYTKSPMYATLQDGWWILKETVFVTDTNEIWLKGEIINERIFRLFYGTSLL